MLINFNDLPNDIMLFIYNINKYYEYKKFINKNIKRDLLNLNALTDHYYTYVNECIGKSIWEHDTDYDYWLEVYPEQKIEMKNKKNIVKYILNNFY